MKPYYKVWVDIERVDEDNDTYENQGLPNQIGGEIKTLEEAEALVSHLLEVFDGT